jgi:hypothetical protein
LDHHAALITAVDGLTAAAAAFNAAWLCAYPLRHERNGRRLAAFALAVVCAGIAVQAAFAQALFTAHRLDPGHTRLFETAPWLASRLLLLAGTLLLSALILRRLPR